MNIDSLPSELLFHILSFLGPSDLCTVAACNSSWAILSSDNVLWRRFVNGSLDYARSPGGCKARAKRLFTIWNSWSRGKFNPVRRFDVTKPVTSIHCKMLGEDLGRIVWAGCLHKADLFVYHDAPQGLTHISFDCFGWPSSEAIFALQGVELSSSSLECTSRQSESTLLLASGTDQRISIAKCDIAFVHPGVMFRTKHIGHLTGHTAGIYSLHLSCSRTRLFSASRDNTVKLWDIQTQQRLSWLDIHTHTLAAIAPNTRKEELLAVCDDNLVQLWDMRLPTGPVASRAVGPPSQVLVHHHALGYAGNMLVSGRMGLEIYDVRMLQRGPVLAPKEGNSQKVDKVMLVESPVQDAQVLLDSAGRDAECLLMIHLGVGSGGLNCSTYSPKANMLLSVSLLATPFLTQCLSEIPGYGFAASLGVFGIQLFELTCRD